MWLDLNSEFTFSLTCSCSKAKEPRLPYSITEREKKWIRVFHKSMNAKWNTNNFVKELNLDNRDTSSAILEVSVI